LVLLAVLGVVAVSLLADNAAKMAVQAAGRKALDVPVTVEKADISILSGTMSLQNLTVANPPGYQRETLLDLDRGDIRMNTRSLLSDTVVIEEIELDGMDVHIEQKGLENNLREVLRTLEQQDLTGKKLQIDSLEITGISVTVQLLPILGQTDTLSFTLTPIRLTNLGHDRPLDMASLVMTILLAVSEKIAEQGGGTLPQDMLTGLEGVLEKTFDLGQIIFGNADQR
jgi:hypothetical protein